MTALQSVAITGATGLIGRVLVRRLLERGLRVVAMVRNLDKARARLGPDVQLVAWDFTAPQQGGCDQVLEEVDAVVHLAGTPLFSKRWTPEFKRQMEESRTLSTRQIVEVLRQRATPPRAFVVASAIGIYGTDPGVDATESTPPGTDILSRICTRWEAEALALEGTRVCPVRIGIVLSTHHGALHEVLPLFRVGLGGVMGQRDTWINWIHLDDTVAVLEAALDDPAYDGPVNAVAPSPATNADYTRTLARVLARPAIVRYPTPLIKAAIGEAGEFASGGARVSSARLQSLGFTFAHPTLEGALRDTISRGL